MFSFLSPDEVERMKLDEERKIASLTQSELTNWNLDDNQSDEDSETEVLNNKFVPKIGCNFFISASLFLFCYF